MKYDLHTHTSMSDGQLSPIELIERARTLNVQTLSITDHDTVAAYDHLIDKMPTDIRLVPGIELSCLWRKQTIHILGLNIDLQQTELQSAIKKQQWTRLERAEKIIHRLSKKLDRPIEIEEIKKTTHNDNLCRPHIASYLMKQGLVKDKKEAFDKYLGKKKIGDVTCDWMDLNTTVDVINKSKGIAVLAHPSKYKFTRTKLMELLSEFKEAGGIALEVISGRQIPALTKDLARMTELKGLYASLGSDFHAPTQSWAELGRMGSLPDNCKPVWELF